MQIVHCRSEALTPAQFEAILALCEAAYEEPLAQEFRNVGPGLHVLAMVNGELVSHTMLVDRLLETGGQALRTAYVELVATAPAHQGRGYATRLLRQLATLMDDHDLGALSPSDAAFYERLGWERWRGPLSVRTSQGEEPSAADEEVMVLRLPRTPAVLDLTAPISVEWRPGDAW